MYVWLDSMNSWSHVPTEGMRIGEWVREGRGRMHGEGVERRWGEVMGEGRKGEWERGGYMGRKWRGDGVEEWVRGGKG